MTESTIEIVRQWLCQGDTDFSRLVGARVFYPYLPDNPTGGTVIFDNTQAGVLLVALDGGPLGEDVFGTTLDVEIRCFGGGAENRKDQRKAWAAYVALRERFLEDDDFVANKRLPAGRLISVAEDKAGTHEMEPALKWPFVSSNWTFETAST